MFSVAIALRATIAAAAAAATIASFSTWLTKLVALR
jgi:hypothetical protein